MAIVGKTPNIAARLQQIAQPNTVMISEATWQLVQGVFECRDRGPQKLKGVSTPLQVYQVLGESEVRSRFEMIASRGLTPLVGREQEVGLLLERWEQVKEGEGQVVLLSGEAGIGKSRLVQVLKERVAGEAHIKLECYCSPYHQNSAFYPLIGLLQRLLEFQRDDSPEEKLHKLEDALERANFSSPEIVPLFAPLLSLPLPDRYPPLTLTPQRQRQKILETSLTWLLRLAQQQPVLVVVEDLQWIDPSTLELLNLVIDQGPTARILTLLTFRPDLFSSPWTFRSHLTQLTLSRLSRKQGEVMVEKVARGKALPVEVFRQLVDKTDGVPLFVEELTKMVLESGFLRERENDYELVGSLPLLAIPATLHDSLMARLDRLGTAKETAQLAATLGREFPYELIQAVSPIGEETLRHDLARLADAELLHQRGLPPQARYLFKHALIQEVAYQSLLKSKRQQSHQQIAQVLQEQFPEVRETQPELLAHHYTAAGLTAQAIPYWQKAGQRALERSANVEAVSHLSKGLELLQTLPDTPARTRQELDLQITLGPALMATKGYAAPEVAQAYARARELCQQVGETPQLLPILLGLGRFYHMRGEHRIARELGEQLLKLAQHMQDPDLLAETYQLLGAISLYMGEPTQAKAYLEQGIAFPSLQQRHSRIVLYGQDVKVACLSAKSHTLWLLGYPEQALQCSEKALTLGRELTHPFSLAFALPFVALLHHWRGEQAAFSARTEELVELAAKQEFPLYVVVAKFCRGWLLGEQGNHEEGLIQMQQAVLAWRAIGAELALPFFLSGLGRVYGKVGQVAEGLGVLTEALAQVDKTGEREWEAELYRLKGELTLQLLNSTSGREIGVITR
jgi:predicted ATPase